MKFSRSLIITGLLFSSVLGSVNVNNINVNAEVNSEDKNKKDITFKFLNNGTEVETKEGTINSENEITSNDIPKMSKDNYRIVSGQNYTITTNDSQKKMVLVKVEKIKKVSVKYTVDGIISNVSEFPTSVDVLDDAKTVQLTELNNNFDGYRLKDDIKNFIVSEKNEITINLEKLNSIKVVFVLENGSDVPILNAEVNVGISDKSVNSESVKAPTGYEVITNKEFPIKELNNKKYVKVAIRKLAQEPVREQETIKINFVDDKGKIILDKRLPKTITVNQNSTKVDLSKIKLPSEYVFGDKSDPFIKDGNVTIKLSKVEPDIVSVVNVNYIDVATKKSVRSINLKGKLGAKFKLNLPEGYKVVEGSSNIVAFVKGVTSVTVFVTKVMDIKDHKSVISTHEGTMASIFDDKGKILKNRVLAPGSTWQSDKVMTRNGMKFYRVATNEWISSENVYEFTTNITRIDTASGYYKMLFDSKGKQITNRGLAANSGWFTDKFATINGEKMYRVATNEWVKASDIK